jgi:hypothetical protein
MQACSYLIKQAIADPLGFVMSKPFKDRTPNEPTREKTQTLQNLYRGLPPGRKRVVNARQRGRGYA